MSKLFGHSMRNVASNAGLLLEDNERFPERPGNIFVERDNIGIFAMPNVPKPVNNRNVISKPQYSNVESTQIFEDISKIEYDGAGNEDINEPSTSTKCFQKRFTSNINSCQDRLSRTAVGSLDRSEQRSRIFCPSPRKTLSSSRLQYKGQGMDYNEVPLTRKFGLGLQSYPLNFGMSVPNTDKLSSYFNFKNKSIFPRMSGWDSKKTVLETHLPAEGNIKFSHNSTTTLSSKNGHFDIPTTTKTFNLGSNNKTLIGGSSVWERIKSNEESRRDDGVFRKPSIPKFVKPRIMSTVSHLVSRNNYEHSNMSSYTTNRFNVTHIPTRDMDTFSDSRLFTRMRDKDMDSRSTTREKVISVDSVFNILENLHHSFLNLSSHIPSQVIRKEIEQAKEMVENRSEMSFAQTAKEIDAASSISHSSRYMCPIAPEKPTEKIDNSISLKSGKDILSALVFKQSKNKALPCIDEEMKSCYYASEKEFSDEENEDSALSFRKPKPYNKFQKKNSFKLKIKTPQVQKNFVSKGDKIKSKQIINLKQWYPVAVGSELIFCGTTENGIETRTEAVKKRVENRKIVLITGIECNLIGNPSEIEASNFDKKIKLALKDGLTARWKVFQKDLLQYQTSMNKQKSLKSDEKLRKSPSKLSRQQEESSIYDVTPKTRRVSPTSKSRTKNHRVSLKVATKRINIKGKSRKSLNNSKKKNSGKAETKSTKKQATPSGEKKSPEKRKTPLSGGGKSAEKTTSAKSRRKSLENNATSDVQKSPRKSRVASKRKSPQKTAVKSRNSPQKKITSYIVKQSPKKQTPDSQVTNNTSLQTKSSQKKQVESSKRKTSPMKTVESVSSTRSKRAEHKYQEREEVSSTSMTTPVLTTASRKSARINSKKKSPSSLVDSTRRKSLRNGTTDEVASVHSSTGNEKREMKTKNQLQTKRKRDMSGEADSTQRKKSKSEKSLEALVESTVVDELEEKKKTTTSISDKNISSTTNKGKGTQVSKTKKKCYKKTTTTTNKNSTMISGTADTSNFHDEIDLQLDDIEIPEVANVSGKLSLNRSQLRMLSSETPPLMYFNTNLKLPKNLTPVQSPDWFTSQRTESEVKQFQRRRALAHKKKIVIERNVVSKVTNLPKGRDLKNVMDWVAEKQVRTPTGSKLLQYMIPSRKQILLDGNENEDEDEGNEPFED